MRYEVGLGEDYGRSFAVNFLLVLRICAALSPAPISLSYQTSSILLSIYSIPLQVRYRNCQTMSKSYVTEISILEPDMYPEGIPVLNSIGTSTLIFDPCKTAQAWKAHNDGH